MLHAVLVLWIYLLAGASGTVGAGDLVYLGELSHSEAYKKGYQDGYTLEDGPVSLEPLAPLAPLPELGDSVVDSYARGIKDGINDREGDC